MAALEDEMQKTFDYIVIGSGSAGGIVAARLSEDGKHRVLCLEAGTKDEKYCDTWDVDLYIFHHSARIE